MPNRLISSKNIVIGAKCGIKCGMKSGIFIRLLALLRHFKKTISWLSEQAFVPEVIRRLLTRALGGEDLEQTLGRVQPERKQERQYQASL